MDKIEGKGRKGKRRQVPAYRGARAGHRRQPLERYGSANARERKDTTGVTYEVVVEINERSDWSARECDGSERRNRSVNVAAR